jgi:hypothetical protein
LGNVALMRGLNLCIELTVGNRLLRGKRRVAFDVARALGELRLSLGHLRLGLGEDGVQGPGVDLEQNVAFAHGCALAVVALDEVSADLSMGSACMARCAGTRKMHVSVHSHAAVSPPSQVRSGHGLR